MSRTLLAFPVLPGRTADDAKRISNEFRARPGEYEASRRRAGITLERAYLQKTPPGDFVVAYIESNTDFTASARLMAESDLAIDAFFARTTREVHGIDMTQMTQAQPPETIAVWLDEHAKSRGKGLAFCAPLIPDAAATAKTILGQEANWKEFAQSRRAKDQSLEVAGLLVTPQGTMGTFYLEGADPVDAIRHFAQSTRPYDLRYKGLLKKLFLPIGDLSQALAGIEEIFDSTQVAELAVDGEDHR
jgi:hypothetical protein